MNLVLGDAEEYRKLPPKKGIPEDEVWREKEVQDYCILDALAEISHSHLICAA